MPGELDGFQNGKGGEPTYYSQASDPVYTIHCQNDPEGAADGSCEPEGKPLHIPSWALPEGLAAGSSANDAHITVIDTVDGLEWDFWQVQTVPLPAGGGSINAGWASRTQLVSTGTNTAGAPGIGQGRSCTAAGIANQIGKIRLEELQAGVINHALSMIVECVKTDSSGTALFKSPAIATARQCKDGLAALNAHAPLTGAHFVYDKSPNDIDTLKRADGTPVPQWKKTILKALYTYGAYVTDTGGKWGFDQESGYEYESISGGVQAWYNFGSSNGWNFYAGDSGDPGARYFGKLYDQSSGSAGDIADATAIDLPNHLKLLQH